MKKVLLRVFKGSMYTIVVLVLLLAINNVLTKSDKFFDIVGFRSYTILTGSMEPNIKPGDLAVVKSIRIDNLNVNDVITFKYDGYTVTHRIIEKNEKGFITKGDNNNVEDREIIKKGDIIGKVITVIPKLGFLVVFLSKPIVIIIALVLLALLILKEAFLDEEPKNVEI